MDLKTLLPGLKTSSSQYYWSLVMEPGWVQAGIWKIENAKAEVVAISPITAWQSDEEIIGAADTALSSAIQNLPEDVKEPSKTIFGVPASWVEGGQIKAEFLDKIRKVCAELSLEPAGFVVLPEAIAHYYKSEEGAPLNAVVLGVGQDTLEIAVFRLGNLGGTFSIARSVSVADDVIEGLTRFAASEPLPSRFIIYDGKEGELENTRQALLQTAWDGVEKVKFLHTPKVEILETDRKVVATSLAGASEISGVSQVANETLPREEAEELLPQEEESNVKTTLTQDVTPQELGFALGSDIAGSVPKPSSPAPQLQPISQPAPVAKKFKFNFKFKMPHLKSGPLVVGGVILAAALLLGTVGYIFLPKATITIYVNPQKINEKADLMVSLTGGADYSGGVIPGQLVKDNEEGQKTTTTTGTKLVGNPAKGTIRIQNGTDNILNLAAQTIILSTGNLKFTTDSAASVSAALSPTSPGTAQVAVTAASIGADYNLAKDEVFKIGTYPKAEVDGISLSEFSGGSSRQISAVSADDLKGLKTDLTGELTDKAQTNLNSKIADGSLLIPQSLVATSSSEVYSAKVGDEAVNVSLKLGILASGVEVVKTDLAKVAQNLLSGKLPTGYTFESSQLATNFTLKTVKDGKYTFGTVFTANLLPQVKTDEIIKNIKGAQINAAQTYLETVPGFVRASVTRKLRIYIPVLDRLPFIAKNISLEVAAEQ